MINGTAFLCCGGWAHHPIAYTHAGYTIQNIFRYVEAVCDPSWVPIEPFDESIVC